MEFVVITGMSGAGKSQAAAILEDMGYYCADNMPAELMPRFAEICIAAEGRYDKVALVSDIRSNQNFDGLFGAIGEIREMGCPVNILFMEASDEVILNRYRETRHRHPLETDEVGVAEAIKRERGLLRSLRSYADHVIDTTGTPLAMLAKKLADAMAGGEGREGMYVSVMAFGFKNGIPQEAENVIDVRFLPNPFYVDELKNLTGRDKAVTDYIFSFPQSREFLEKVENMLAFLLPKYSEEGKSSTVIAFGCTGGRHRSVAMASCIAEYVQSLGYRSGCVFRELG